MPLIIRKIGKNCEVVRATGDAKDHLLQIIIKNIVNAEAHNKHRQVAYWREMFKKILKGGDVAHG